MGGCIEDLGFKTVRRGVFASKRRLYSSDSSMKNNKIGPKILKIQAALNSALEHISTDDPISLLKCKSQIQRNTSNSVPLSRNIQSVKVARYGESLFCPRGALHSDPSCPKRSDVVKS